jgi:hypothetical protein
LFFVRSKSWLENKHVIMLAMSPSDTTTTNAASNPLIAVVSDLVLKLLFELGLKSQLDKAASSPDVHVKAKVVAAFKEIQASLSPADVELLNTYFTTHAAQTQLFHIFSTAIKDILADGKVNAEDAGHFVVLVTQVVRLFNTSRPEAASASPGGGSSTHISSDALFVFLYFVIKCVVVVVLDPAQETVALTLLTQAFELLKLTVAPIDIQLPTRCTAWFSCCMSKNK